MVKNSDNKKFGSNYKDTNNHQKNLKVYSGQKIFIKGRDNKRNYRKFEEYNDVIMKNELELITNKNKENEKIVENLKQKIIEQKKEIDNKVKELINIKNNYEEKIKNEDEKYKKLFQECDFLKKEKTKTHNLKEEKNKQKDYSHIIDENSRLKRDIQILTGIKNENKNLRDEISKLKEDLLKEQKGNLKLLTNENNLNVDIQKLKEDISKLHQKKQIEQKELNRLISENNKLKDENSKILNEYTKYKEQQEEEIAKNEKEKKLIIETNEQLKGENTKLINEINFLKEENKKLNIINCELTSTKDNYIKINKLPKKSTEEDKVQKIEEKKNLEKEIKPIDTNGLNKVKKSEEKNKESKINKAMQRIKKKREKESEELNKQNVKKEGQSDKIKNMAQLLENCLSKKENDKMKEDKQSNNIVEYADDKMLKVIDNQKVIPKKKMGRKMFEG